MPRRALPVALALAAVISGCGAAGSSSGNFKGDEKAVADQVEKLQSAGQSGDAKQICDEVLSRALRDQIAAEGSTCQTQLDLALDDADDFDLTVEDVAISGNTATAKVRGRVGDGDQVRTMKFVREGQDWRASSFGG
jgi:hypothetical protein